jgi:hypothetical protein
MSECTAIRIIIVMAVTEYDLGTEGLLLVMVITGVRQILLAWFSFSAQAGTNAAV